jgi:6-pyruvoyltetrahydropterin/6-carboxytetrahydropterin synthase
MVYLTKIMHFSASHRIYNPNFTNEENNKIFGQCANINGHGHNYELEVIVAGEPNPDTGYVIDLKQLKDIIQKEIIDKFDHKNLNIDVKELDGIIPTSENLVILFWNILENKFPNSNLFRIRLSENFTSRVEYYGN